MIQVNGFDGQKKVALIETIDNKQICFEIW